MLALLNTAILTAVLLLSQSASGATKAEEMAWVMVDKKQLRASLLSLPSYPQKPQLIKDFKVAIGKAHGDKEREGDNKTPEGIYFARPHIPGRSLWQPKYGPLAIPIDFPNVLDKKHGKSGYGIWLHGAGNDTRIQRRYVTEGCVALFNSEIEELGEWLPPRVGIVVIAADSSRVQKLEDRRRVRASTLAWIKDWQSGDIDRYIGHYSRNFRHHGRDISAFYRHKKRIFQGYREMRIDVSHLRVLVHEKYAVALMNQDFRGDSAFRSQGRKVLYWVREGSGWKISGETFGSTLFRPLLAASP